MSDLQTPSEQSELFYKWLVTMLNEIVHTDNHVNKEALWPKSYQLHTSSSFEEW